MIQSEQIPFPVHAIDSSAQYFISGYPDTTGKNISLNPPYLSNPGTFITQTHGKKPEFTLRNQEQRLDAFVLIVLGFSLFSLVISKYLLPRRFFQLLSCYTADRWTNQLLREWNPSKSMPGPLLLIVYIFLFSLVLYIIQPNAANQFDSTSEIALNIALIMLLYTFGRLGLSKIIALIFKAKELNLHLRTIEFSHYLVSSFAMLPAIVAMVFYPGETTVKISLAFISIVFIFSFLRTLFFSVKAVHFSVFYLFLYLCALEIVPFLLLLKTVNLYLTGELFIIDFVG